MLAATPETLREAGLSFAKIAAARDLAQKTIDGIVPPLEEARKMSDEELVERLDSVRGIGAWTVEMFLIFRLGRPDVLPIHDYGVQKGFALLYGKRKIPKPKELARFGERWRPYRTVASWYMWRAVEVAGKDARKVKKNAREKEARDPQEARFTQAPRPQAPKSKVTHNRHFQDSASQPTRSLRRLRRAKQFANRPEQECRFLGRRSDAAEPGRLI